MNENLWKVKLSRGMFLLLRSATVLLVFLLFFQLNAQALPELVFKNELKDTTKLVSGKIVDEEGTPLPGVNVIEKGTENGTITDLQGQFKLNVSENATLLISFIGYNSMEVAVEGKNQLDISMEMASEDLEEVVVVGYGTQKKETLTGAVTSIKGEEISKIPVTNVSQGIAGNLPGVVAISNGGEPGYDGATLLIRGVNTFGNSAPLVVVDGVPGRNLERIDPSTIESMSVLKDASAAIYGAQAANGVILITTKKGSAGKTKVVFTHNQGYATPTILPEMTNAAEYATLLNEIDIYKNRDPRYSSEDIELYRNGQDPWGHPNSDYWDATLKKWATQTYSNLSLNGGGEKVRYFISASDKSQGGFYKGNGLKYDQYDLRSNLSIDLNKYIDAAVNVYGRIENRNYPGRGAGEIFNKLMRAKPIIPAFWPSGEPGPGLEAGDNPAMLSSNATGYQNDKWYTINSDYRLNIRIPHVEGLSVALNASVDKAINFKKNWATPWDFYTWDGSSLDSNEDPILTKNTTADDPSLWEQSSDHQTILTRGMINYEKVFGDAHAMKLMVGVERIEGKGNDIWAFRRYFTSTAVDQLFAGGAESQNNGGGAYKNTRLNYFGRANYAFRNKYLLEFVWRYQGSYIFSESERFGFFPGVTAGYVISEENFWKNNIKVINFFKIRASYGETGNDLVAPYQYLSNYFYSGRNFLTNNGEVENKALYSGVLPNQNFTWESGTQRDIGVDIELFDGHVSITADYFYNNRTNILTKRSSSVPSTFGLGLPDENIGRFENKGFDFNVGYRNKSGELTYSISANGTYAKNKVLFWDEAPGALPYQQTTGYSLGSGLYYNAIGIFQDQEQIDNTPHWAGARPGDVIFEDYDGDGEITAADRIREEKTRTPIFSAGLNVNLSYKGFDLNVLFQGAFGGIFYQGTESGDFGNYMKSFYDNRWTEENPSTTDPRTYNRSDEYWVSQPNTYWLHKTDYVRLKTVELGYTLPSSLTRKASIESVRVYVSGFNLFTYSPDMKDFDPENVAGQYAGYNYPLNKVLNAGLSVTF